MTELVQPIKRVEQYLYALCVLDFSNIPVPRSRLEIFTHAMITGEIPEIAPETREEEYMVAIIKGDVANLPTPKSRADHLLYRICLGETETRDIEIETRYEMLLAYLAEHGRTDLEYALINYTKAFETLYNTVEMPVKSAILKGQTLANLQQKGTWSINGSGSNQNASYSSPLPTSILKPSTKYYVKFNKDISSICKQFYFVQSTDIIIPLTTHSTGAYGIITTPSTLDSKTTPIHIYPKDGTALTLGQLTDLHVMIIEYQEGMENWDIPFFDGMQSVQMPVLTTTGKNLFDKTKITFGRGVDLQTGIIGGETGTNITDFIKVIPNTQYTMSFNFTTNAWTRCFGLTEPKHGKYVTDANGVSDKCYFDTPSKTYTITTSPTTNYLMFLFGNGVEETFQLEQGSTATTYEPYQTNILSCNEDVELRDIKDTKYFNGSSIGKKFTDVLDCINGELKIQTNKVTMDGSKQPILSSSKENVSIFKYKPNDILINSSYDGGNIFICDKLKFVSALWEKDEEGYCYSNNDGITFSISNNKFTDINEYLSQNPITFIYPLAQESIKTVDLIIQDQDNQPTKLKSFNDVTHVETQADSVLPTVILEYGTKNQEVLAALSQDHEEVADAQAALSDAIDSQSDEVETTMMALTEVYEGRNEE